MGLLACLATPAAALAAPRSDVPSIVHARFKSQPIAGEPASLEVRARDPRHPVSAFLVAYSDSFFGESACRPRDSRGRRPRRPFRKGSTVNFAVTHTYTLGAQPLGLLISSGGCDGRAGGAVARSYTATAVAAGAASVQNLTPGVLVAMPALQGAGTGANGNDKGQGNGPVSLPGLHVLPSSSNGKDTRQPKASTSLARTAQACEGADEVPTMANLAVARQATLCLLNQQRTARGLRALRSNDRLSAAALWFSGVMVQVGFFDHRAPDGSLPVTRARRVGYIKPRYYWRIAENVGFGQQAFASPRGMVEAWMQSTGHRTNILDPGFREIGIGIVEGAPIDRTTPGATYTTDFGVLQKLRRKKR